MSRHEVSIFFALFLLSLLLSGIAFARVELITNGTFDTGISGWAPSISGDIAWASAEGHNAPGALKATNIRTSASAYSAGAEQCVSLPSPQADYYTVQGWIKVPAQTNGTAEGYIRLQFYTNADCTGTVGTRRDSARVLAGSPWTFVSKTTSRPAAAQSVEVRLYVYKTGTTSAYAYFDDISLFPSTSNAVGMIDPDKPPFAAPPFVPGPLWALVLVAAVAALPLAAGRICVPLPGLRSAFRGVSLRRGAPIVALALTCALGRSASSPARAHPAGAVHAASPYRRVALASGKPGTASSPTSGPWLPRDTSPPGRRSVFLDPVIPDPPPFPAVKLLVDREGIYAVTGADLASVPGWDPTADPRTFRLIRRGQEIPIRLTGEQDGHFDPQDRLLFYGQPRPDNPMFTKYGVEEVYWLTWGKGAGLRVGDEDARPLEANPSIEMVTDTVRLEEDREWYTHHSLDFPTRDTWWWGRIRAAGEPAEQTFVGHIPAPVSDLSALLRYEVAPRGRGESHHLRVALNGEWLDERTFDGHFLQVYTTTIPAGLLTSQVALKVQVVPKAGGSDDLYLDGYSITYTRALIAQNDYLAVTVSPDKPSTLVVKGFSSRNVEVWDVADPGHPVRLSPVDVREGVDGVVVRVGVSVGRHRIIAAARGAFQHPRLESYTPTNWRDPSWGADAIIITSRNLMPAAERLAAYRRAQGTRVILVDVESLYDEFAWGWYHPEAIRAFLAYAHRYWRKPAPRYVILFGDGHWNFRGFNVEKYGPLPPNHVPPYLAWVDPWQGEVPVDQAYVTFAGNDDLPDMIVGRIPVDTPEEANAVVDKIMAYEREDHAGWPRRFLFVADNADAAGDFPLMMHNIASSRPLWARANVLSLGEQDTTAARARLVEEFGRGLFVLAYAGHGSVSRWANEPLLNTADLAGLTNERLWPVIVTLNCLDGYFAYPSTQTSWQAMAEVALRLPGRGSIAAWSPAGLGNINRQEPLAGALFEELAHPGTVRLGDVLSRARVRFYRAHGPDAIFFTQTLFGDPLLRLRVPYTTAFPLVTTK